MDPSLSTSQKQQYLHDSKLRLMCSYGGHITPRDNSLFYIGGDTRIVAVDRHSSLTHLYSHLSRTLLHGRKPFTLKYHLPNEDLDNLITVSTDEDLQNMIEEYDRLSSNPSPSPSRLRLFLFFSKPDTAVSMDNYDDDHPWFVEALNNSGILSRVVSDSAAVLDNCLLNLDDDDDHVSASSNNGENSNSTNVKEHLIDIDFSVHVEEEDNNHNMFNYSIAKLGVDDDGTTLPNDIKSEVCDQNQQHQFAYIIHAPTATPQVPISSYYPIYAPQLHQYPVYANQFQQQQVNWPQNQSIYGYEYGGAMQVYYPPQHPVNANVPLQYQSMTPAAAASALSNVSKQFPIHNNQQPN